MLFLVRNRETDKNVAVFGHDSTSGRLVLRARPSDSSLLQTFNLWRDRQIIVQLREMVAGRPITRRYRVLPTDADYGKHLVDRFIFRPYEVRFSKVVEGDTLDAVVDNHYALVDAAPPRTPAPFAPAFTW